MTKTNDGAAGAGGGGCVMATPEVLPEDFDAIHAANLSACTADPAIAPPFDHGFICNQMALAHAMGRHAGAPMFAKADADNVRLNLEIGRLKGYIWKLERGEEDRED